MSVRDDEGGSVGNGRDPASPPEWGRPHPLSFTGRRPAFPVNALPDWLAEYVYQTGEATQTPEDLPGCLSLSALGAIAGGKAVIEVRIGWREPLNVFATVAMEPGERKTPVFMRIMAPLIAAEEAAAEAERETIERARAAQKVARQTAERAISEAAKAEGAERDTRLAEAMLLAAAAGKMSVPAAPRLLADDSTPEALASLMAEQGGRIAVLADEGDVFDLMAGRYNPNAGPNLAIYLKGHAGSPHRVDRKGRAPEYIPAPALTLGLAVQPDVLRSIAGRPGFRGRGLLARFLWSVPASALGYRSPGACPVEAAVIEAYEENMRSLAGAFRTLSDPALLVLTPEADARVLAAEKEIEPLLRPGGELRPISDWGAKLVGHAVRLAGLLHIAQDPTPGAWLRPVEADTIEYAWDLARYFKAHALIAFDHMGADPVLDAARRVGEWATAIGAFTAREAYNSHRSLFPRVDDLADVLDLLTDAHWVRERATPEGPRGRGRPPSPTYDVNPQLLDAQIAQIAEIR